MALVRTTGKDSELRKTIPITRLAGERLRVVMRLRNGRGGSSFTRLPELSPGDRLRVTAEVEVTTDCQKASAACLGKPYTYAPLVDARLFLTGDREAKVEGPQAILLGERRRLRAGHRLHHLVIVFTSAGLRILDAGLPWSGPSFVNLVLDAYHPLARSGDKLLVGENDPPRKGKPRVVQDKGRINAIRLRPRSEEPRRRQRTNKRLAKEIPVLKGGRIVVYSRRLANLKDSEVLEVRAKLRVSAAHLGYPARISTRVILADRPDQTNNGGRAEKIAPLNGEISEHNGFNCLNAKVCTSEKVGVMRLRESAGKALYVNLVAASADPFSEGRPGDKLRVLEGGYVKVLRYEAG